MSSKNVQTKTSAINDPAAAAKYALEAKKKYIELYGEEVYNRWLANTSLSLRCALTSNRKTVDSLSVDDAIKNSIGDFSLVENGVVIARLNLASNINPAKKYYVITNIGTPMLYELMNYTNIFATICKLPDELAVALIVSQINFNVATKSSKEDVNKFKTLPYKVYTVDGKPVAVNPMFEEGDDFVTLSLFNTANDTSIDVLKLLAVESDFDMSKQYMSLYNNITNEHYNVEVILLPNDIIEGVNLVPDVLAVQTIEHQIDEINGVNDDIPLDDDKDDDIESSTASVTVNIE